MKVRGSQGTLKRRQLTKKMSVQFTFGRGTSEVFHIKGPVLGDIQYLTIEVSDGKVLSRMLLHIFISFL